MKLRRYLSLILLLLCLCGGIYAQSSVLETKVSLQYKEISIGEILKDIKKRYHVKFSYSNSIVPESKRVNVHIKNVMLKDALYDVFRDTDVSFQVVGDQIVLKKGIKRTSSMAQKRSNLPPTTLPVLYTPTMDEDALLVSNSNDIIVDTMPDELGLEVPLLNEDTTRQILSKKDIRRKYKGERKLLKAKFYILKDSLRSKGGNTLSKLDMKYNYVVQKMKQEYYEIKNPSSKTTSVPVVPTSAPLDSNVLKDTVSKTKEDYLYKPFQVTFVSPIGTNGHDCGRTVNNISFNGVAGYAAGLDGMELGGVANVEKDYVSGIQMAGAVNVVKGKTTGIQLAGFANLCGDTVKALQSAGFLNTTNGSFEGMQTAGFCNVDRGSVQGFQGAGFLNVAQDSLKGFQIAGFANLQNGNVRGIQASGFLNTAKNVHGMQIGIINISDSMQGVPIGLLNIVRKNGYRRLDIFGSDALYANVAYKIGVRRLYSIFETGAQVTSSNLRIGAGYGFGSEAGLGNRMVFNIEHVSMYVWEQDMNQLDLNMLNKLSTTMGVRLGKRTTIYAGPTVNAMVSQYQDPSSSSIGSNLAPYTLYEHTFDGGSYKDVNLKLWIGFNAGIRF